MDWKTDCVHKVVTPQQAVRLIRSHSRIVIGHAAGRPLTLIETLFQNKSRYHDVEIIYTERPDGASQIYPGQEKHFRYNTFFVGEDIRDIIIAGKGDFTPIDFSKITTLFHRKLPIDVALIQVSPPDKHGYCSLGPVVDYLKEAVECAQLVIAEINNQVPRTLGDSFIHLNRIDYAVMVDRPLPEFGRQEPDQRERDAGRNCAKLICDGDTIQAGTGSACEAALMALDQKKDLGIHSDVFTDAMLDLVEQGVVTGRRKTLHRDKIVTAALVGSKRLYEFADNNPGVLMRSIGYVGAPEIIMRNQRMVSISSCMEVDLMGQVVAESIGLAQLGGIGSQADFVHGATMSPHGRSIIVMPSTSNGGQFSRIVPFLEEGAAVSVSRNNVDYLVTEYGIVELRGKTLQQRAQALISIAHPNFQLGLIEEYENRFFQKYTSTKDCYQQQAIGE